MKKMYNNTFPQQKIKIKKLYLNFFKNILKIMKSITIKIPEGTNLDDAIQHFNKVEGVLQVNKDAMMQLH